jgi:ribose/xylose/arabinose/galactoside ABC-type transport system permease subunit
MFSTSQSSSIRTVAAEAVTQLMFAAIVVVVVGGTAAMCLERSVLFA